MNDSYYPSTEEIQRCQAAEFESLHRATVFAQYDDPPTLPIRYRAVVREKGFQTHAAANRSPTRPKRLLDDHGRFMADIAKTSGAGLKERYDRLGVGISRGNRILAELKEMGLVTVEAVKSVNPSGGRARLVASLTTAGKEWLSAHEATP